MLKLFKILELEKIFFLQYTNSQSIRKLSSYK